MHDTGARDPCGGPCLMGANPLIHSLALGTIPPPPANVATLVIDRLVFRACSSPTGPGTHKAHPSVEMEGQYYLEVVKEQLLGKKKELLASSEPSPNQNIK